MVKKGIIFLILFIFLISLSGCATGSKQNLQNQGLRNQIQALEAQIQNKDEEISSLKGALDKTAQEKETLARETATGKVIPEVKSRPTIKHIQIALRNAGYNPGPIDGRMGRQTKDAIRAFQRANNLAADGKVGKQTWGLLKGYLYKKVK
jgi:murein L,D-transpeptidase YcbB/YkuD